MGDQFGPVRHGQVIKPNIADYRFGPFSPDHLDIAEGAFSGGHLGPIPLPQIADPHPGHVKVRRSPTLCRQPPRHREADIRI